MSVIERKYVVAVKDVGISNVITNKGILKFLEDIACLHSEIAGFGINQMEQTHLSWVLLQWKVRVLKRAIYNQTIIVKTWAREANRCFTYRDFEIYDEKGNLLCIASSKWALVTTDEGKMVRITPEVMSSYNIEENKFVFEEPDIAKLKEPEALLEENLQPDYHFTVLRRDIDMNQHMHNLYYLDYALESLSEDVYNISETNEFEIMYKSGAKLGDAINCFYVEEPNAHTVVMKNAEDNRLHAIVKLSM